jgi:membrane-bound lytic murein transglycosylase B
MSWDKYKGLFITENRIKNGIKFWQDNLATLQRAEKIYHVQQTKAQWRFHES